MTDNEMRIEVAKLCGWTTPHDCARTPVHKWQSPFDGCCYDELPDFVNDLNAMHEAEKTLNVKDQVWYLQRLTQVRFREGVSGMIGCMIDKTTFATARQRCEAFLRMRGLWKE